MKAPSCLFLALAAGLLWAGCATGPQAWKGKTDIGHISCSEEDDSVGLPALLNRPPRFKVKVKPEYPAEALRAGLTAVVKVHFTLSEDGRITRIQAARNTPTVFLDAAERCVAQWRMAPRVVKGKHVPSYLTAFLGFGCEAPRLDTYLPQSPSEGWVERRSGTTNDFRSENYEPPSAR